jgi:hypothetical protein
MIFSPATIECASPVDVWFTAHLPNSVHSGDTVNMNVEVNGRAMNDYLTPMVIAQNTASPVPDENSARILIQPDGSWLVTGWETASDVALQCGPLSGNTPGYAPGSRYMFQFLNSGGQVLAEGGFSVT